VPEESQYIQTVDGVLRVVVARTADGDALNHPLMRRFTAAVEAIGPGTGAILLTGEGANFSTGGNVKDFAAAADPARLVARYAAEFHEFVLALMRTPVPVVAAAKGWAAGGGLSLALAADVIVGSPATRMRAAYATLGFSTDGGLSWTLPRAVGLNRARDLILADTVLTGTQAFAAGLLTRLVPDGEVDAEALAAAAGFVGGPTAGYAQLKRLLRLAPDRGLAEQLDDEAATVARRADSPDGREGVAAFIARRPAEFGLRSELNDGLNDESNPGSNPGLDRRPGAAARP
jgi:2-(1,2-epoxy-1,2-dihydrophenyl)acetyl-CoA isomerase